MTWLPPLAAHRVILAVVHAGVPPLIPALPFVADGPSTPDGVIGAAASTVLGFGVLGILALALTYVVWKGSFTPSKRVDELVAAGRVDLLRENEQLREELARAQAQLAENLRFAKEDLTPILFQFTSATTNLLPILQQVAYLLPTMQQMVFRQQAEPPPRRDLP